MRKILIPVALLLGIAAKAQQNPTDSLKQKELKEVNISGQRNVYKVDSSLTVSKMPLKDLENHKFTTP